MTNGPAHATPEAEQAPPQPVAVEPALGAMAPVPLMVGHAEDHAEHDADARADTALSRLRRLEGEPHSHGPGCEHSTVSRGEVRRSATPASGAPVVGYEGGALDSGTSSAIESRRGSGRALDADVRRRMETAFNTSFSSVRIHDDSHAAKLNTAVSATAFTTGKDIFFGSRQYAPGTPGGDRVLAHELAHTLQPDSGPRRKVATAPGVSPKAHAAIVRSVATTNTVRRGIFDSIFGKKKPAAGPAPEAAAPPKPQPLAPPPPPPGFKGKGGALPSTAVEGAKGGIVGGVVGGAGAAGQFGSAATPMLGGLTGGAAGVLTTADAMMGLNNARGMNSEANEYGDQGLSNLAGRKGKNQGMQALTGAASVAKGGVEMGYLAGTGIGKTSVMSAMKAGAGNATLGAAAGGLGVAVGSLQTAQGLWRSGKAVQKLCRLAWGRSKDMYSDRGANSWKPAVLSAERFKLGVGVVKTALGVLGIAAGALLIVSNPIGWGIGIAAAIAGGVYAATKIAAKISDAKARTRIAAKIANGDDADAVVGEGGMSTAKGSKDKILAKTAKSNERSDRKAKGSKSEDDQHERNFAIEQANEVARLASSTAVVASEMRDRMLWADDTGNEKVWKLLKGAIGDSSTVEAQDGLDMTWASESERELFDAYMLLSTINVSREEAVSPMGQELIGKKLSKMESM